MEALIQTSWVRNTNELYRCLDTQFNACTTCRGYSKNKPTCGNPISKVSRSQITSVLLNIVESGSITCAINHLETLASLVLCRRYHQNQIAEKVTQWRSRLVSFLTHGAAVTQEADTRNHPKSTKASTQLSGTRVNIFKTPAAVQPSTFSHAEAKPGMSLMNTVVKEEQHEQHVKTEDVPLALDPLEDTVKCNDTIHTFEPYYQPKHLSMINKDIANKLNTPFMKREKEGFAKGEGYIYGYQLPQDHKTTSLKACQVVKIGYTNDYKRRMKEWQEQCHYEPQLVFAYKVTHHVKMEKIIHLLLRNYQRKEKCPGCPAQHHEFFEVDASTAEAVVRMWAVWARLRPFDDGGSLSSYWSQKIKEMNTEDPDCWEKLIFDKVK
ncbi:chitin synthase [Colletotrichum chrysophilum]|uniref:Chitin synthase n=1 Tax=Colletotrichum chrysophilum TaxID=1836956 RepID=A0AAD9EQ83_9PEZI|nr:chitin synthase [Colletotrichum chrysophilum]